MKIFSCSFFVQYGSLFIFLISLFSYFYISYRLSRWVIYLIENNTVKFLRNFYYLKKSFNMNSDNILYFDNEQFISNWPATLKLAYDFFYGSSFTQPSLEKLFLDLATDDALLLNDEQSNKDPLKAKDYMYGLDGFVKENFKLYYHVENKMIPTYISLENISVKDFACSCINCVVQDVLQSKDFRFTFWLIIFRIIEESTFQVEILNILEKNNVLKHDFIGILEASIIFFDESSFQIIYKKFYKKMLQFLKIPKTKTNELLNDCINQQTLLPIVHFLNSINSK